MTMREAELHVRYWCVFWWSVNVLYIAMTTPEKDYLLPKVVIETTIIGFIYGVLGLAAMWVFKDTKEEPQ